MFGLGLVAAIATWRSWRLRCLSIAGARRWGGRAWGVRTEVGAGAVQPPGRFAGGLGGNLYVADTGNHTIRMINSQGIVTTIAGAPGQSGDADGTGLRRGSTGRAGWRRTPAATFT